MIVHAYIGGDQSNISASGLLSHTDKEANSALHAAVNSADLDAVKLCLKYGAKIDHQKVCVINMHKLTSKMPIFERFGFLSYSTSLYHWLKFGSCRDIQKITNKSRR